MISPQARPLAVGQVDRIAVFRALHLGDFMCATPALRALKQRFPAAELTLIGLSWNRVLVPRFPYIDRFLDFPGYYDLEEVPWDDRRTRRFLLESQDYRYDLAVQMHGNGRISNAFVAQLKARTSLGHRPADAGWPRLLSVELEDENDQRDDEHVHQILRWLRLVGEVGATGSAQLEFPLLQEDREEAVAVAKRAGIRLDRPLVGINPGGKGLDKRWPAERFAEVADHLVAETGAEVAITGIESERGLAVRIARMMRHRAFVVAGETTIGGLAALMERMSLFVTNDTGSSHIAAALGTPSVTLFGPTDPAEWAPLDSNRHLALWSGRGRPIAGIATDLVVEKSLMLVK